MSFIHLQVRSGYSLLSSTVKIEELVMRARELQFSAVALTDENVLYGVIPFYKACQAHGIKPIIGMIATVFDEHGHTDQLVLLAKNNDGYRQLVHIATAIQLNDGKGISLCNLSRYTSELIGMTSGVHGRVEQHLLNGEIAQAETLVHTYAKLFQRGDFYINVQRHGLQEQEDLLPLLFEHSKRWDMPLVATNDVRYMYKEDALAYECLLAMKHGKKMTDSSRPRLAANEYYLKSADDMTALFSICHEAVEETVRIAERCDVTFEHEQWFMPRYPVPSGTTADEHLQSWCWEQLTKRFPNRPQPYVDRLQYELQIIQQMNFSDYFLIVADFVRFAREQGIFVGPGRGSAAGSLVAYILGITQIDPLQYGLLFERFLNPARLSLPDIDIDFPDDRREEVIRYIEQKYGKDYVAQIITFGTFGTRSAIREVGRVFDVDEHDVQQTLHTGRLDHTRPWHRVVQRIEGLPKHTSIHAAGIVISPCPLTDIVPLQSGQTTTYVTQYAMDALEQIGLLKFDLLALKNLTTIEQMINSIEKRTGRRLRFDDVPLDDEQTYALFSQGDTFGVFQLESEGMKRVLRELKPTTFEDIVAVNALFRPGPMEQIPTYISRKHRRESIVYMHDDLKSILQSTYGVIIYQEQIMKIAEKMANFSLTQADLLRRAISKKDVAQMEKEKRRFIEGCMQNGYADHVANELYELIVRFAGYGFNRSHAVTYSYISYMMAYIKAHYPLDFYAALLTNVSGQKEKMMQCVYELRKKRIRLLPPSIGRSEEHFTVDENGIRFGFLAIKQVNSAFIKQVILERRKRPFSDFFDFVSRLRLEPSQRKMVEAFIFSGCFDEFRIERATLYASIDVAFEHAQFFTSLPHIRPKYVHAEPLSLIDQLKHEKQWLGVYVSPHPVESFSHFYSIWGAKRMYEWEKEESNYGKVIAYVEEVMKKRTKKGEEMAFLTICDDSDEWHAIVFPASYRRFHSILQQGTVLYMEGKIEKRMNGWHLIVQQLRKPECVYVKIDEQHASPIVLQQLKNVLTTYRGHVPVVLYYEAERKKVQLSHEYAVSPQDECMKQLTALLGDGNVVVK
ncbi:DNA polymerase III catalytic subunit, DnaE type [Anoxybacillus pushchinoensis]|uniref:DNA-directed DNA polymerase n=1 Tax=Anoxybacillus pushchinoensis TaxID=150248 RepID=A0A1I0TAN5_9BACL|nr:DNA polymerase III subunit alpha [Anoxybacillus pushchinoensis]SFA48848.1 DNA polymerase III catalytic subunit, DnaE type [Anoxybacillus pushchinoensis]